MSDTLVTLLNAVSAAGAGAETVLTADNYSGGGHSIEVSGSFVATVEFEARIDTNWVSLGSLTTPGMLNISGTFKGIRGNVTSYTSGSITMKARYGLADASLASDVQTLLNRLTDARATLLDNLNRLDVAVSSISAAAQIDNLITELRNWNKL